MVIGHTRGISKYLNLKSRYCEKTLARQCLLITNSPADKGQFWVESCTLR